MTVVNPKSISGINSITTGSGSDNLLTIHTNEGTERVRVDSTGTTKVGSGVTLSPDGDIFATGVTTATSFVGDLTGDVTGTASNATLSVNAQGLTGTPNITVGSVNASSGTFSGNVDISGVLTYEDVTNVDSIGLITARNGVVVGSGITLSKDGDVFATGVSTSTKVHVGVDTGVYDEDLVVTGDARVTGILTIGTGSIILDPTAKQLRGLEEIVIGIANTITIKQDTKGEIEFTDARGTPKSVGIGSTVSINTSGIVTATSFVGDLTGDTTGDLTGNVYLSQGFVYSGSTTVTSTSQTAIDTFPAATYRSAKYQVQITRGSEYHITEVYLVHDGTSSYGTEYATIKTGSQLATFDSDINSGNVRLLATPTSSSSTVFKVIATLTKV